MLMRRSTLLLPSRRSLRLQQRCVLSIGALFASDQTHWKVSDWESVLHSLKLCLHTSNQLLSAAALSTLLPYLSLLLNAQTPPGSSRSHASWPPQDPYILRQVFSAILTPGGVFERLGDRERPQLKARQIVVLLGEASSHCSPLPCTQSASKGREKNNETPMNIFERHLRELGLGSKVWKIREQVGSCNSCTISLSDSNPVDSYLARYTSCSILLSSAIVCRATGCLPRRHGCPCEGHHSASRHRNV